MAAHRKFTVLPVMQGLDIVTGFRTVMDLLPLYSFPGRPKLHLTQRHARYTSERDSTSTILFMVHGASCKAAQTNAGTHRRPGGMYIAKMCLLNCLELWCEPTFNQTNPVRATVKETVCQETGFHNLNYLKCMIAQVTAVNVNLKFAPGLEVSGLQQCDLPLPLKA